MFPNAQYWVHFFFLFELTIYQMNLTSSVKLFDDDSSLFTIVKDKNESANIANNDLLLISRFNL